MKSFFPDEACSYAETETSLLEIEHPLGGGDVSTVFSVSLPILKELNGVEGIGSEEQPFRLNHRSIDLRTTLMHSRLLRQARSLPRENIIAFEETVFEFLEPLCSGRDSAESGQPLDCKRSTREAHRALAKRTVVYLNENFTISGLAKEVFSAPFHLCRVFRRETGLTLHAYVSRLRLTTALTRLKETDVLLKELALDFGYSSQSHFSSSLVKAIQGWKEAVFRFAVATAVIGKSEE